jgi:hypothetical protein
VQLLVVKRTIVDLALAMAMALESANGKRQQQSQVESAIISVP